MFTSNRTGRIIGRSLKHLTIAAAAVSLFWGCKVENPQEMSGEVLPYYTGRTGVFQIVYDNDTLYINQTSKNGLFEVLPGTNEKKAKAVFADTQLNYYIHPLKKQLIFAYKSIEDFKEIAASLVQR